MNLTLPELLDGSSPTTAAVVARSIVDPARFRELLVSHRRMERFQEPSRIKMRGLKDLDTGEIFLVDERRLLERSR
nr:hypothetical protein [Pirellula staleyi]